MARTKNTFEGGSDGTAVSTANSGGASGDAFTVTAVGTGASIVYDAASAKAGLLGAKLVTGTAGNTYLQRNYGATAADFSAQCWWKFDAAPSAAVQGPISIRTGANGAVVRLTFNTGRTLQISGSATSSASAALVAGVWYYLDFYGAGVGGGAATLNLDIYNADASLFGAISRTADTTAAVPQIVEWGTHSFATLTHRFDDVTADVSAGVGAGGYPVALVSDYVRRSGAWVAYTPTVRRSGAWV